MIYTLLPETLHCKKMPYTIDEALAIGQTKLKANRRDI